MELIRISLKSLVKLDDITLCLGYFDSLHLGHLTLIKKSMNLGKKVGVLTMDPNPSSFFIDNVKEINSIDDKIEILKEVGADYFIILETDRELLNISAERFVKDILIPLGVKNVVCGFDYHFGKDKQGDSDMLSYYEEFDTYVCDPIVDNEEKVSTTLIKSLLKDGNIKRVNKLLVISTYENWRDDLKLNQLLHFSITHHTGRQMVLMNNCSLHVKSILTKSKITDKRCLQ